jgi:hypothetical protein
MGMERVKILKAELHKEKLEYEEVKVAQRSYE